MSNELDVTTELKEIKAQKKELTDRQKELTAANRERLDLKRSKREAVKKAKDTKKEIGKLLPQLVPALTAMDMVKIENLYQESMALFEKLGSNLNEVLGEEEL